MSAEIPKLGMEHVQSPPGDVAVTPSVLVLGGGLGGRGKSAGQWQHSCIILAVPGLNLAMRLSQMPWRARPQAKGIEGRSDANM